MKVKIFITLFSLFLIYSGFVYTSATEKHAPRMGSDAMAGKLLFQKYNCTACHQLYGLGGYLGSDLTSVMSQKGKGGPYVRAILKTGTKRMPDFNLPDGEINKLIEFLKSVDASAVTSNNKM